MDRERESARDADVAVEAEAAHHFRAAPFAIHLSISDFINRQPPPNLKPRNFSPADKPTGRAVGAVQVIGDLPECHDVRFGVRAQITRYRSPAGTCLTFWRAHLGLGLRSFLGAGGGQLHPFGHFHQPARSRLPCGSGDHAR